MSRVITFSRQFPAYHPRKGGQTNFVEKILNQDFVINMMFKDGWRDEGYRDYLVYLNEGKIKEGELTCQQIVDFYNSLNKSIRSKKLHTIRATHRWKPGDKFSPRVWSGRPYHDSQITFAPDKEIKKVWDFKVRKFIDGYWIDFGSYNIPESLPLRHSILPMVAKNDGLSLDDFLEWFKWPSKFDGQIIAWDENVNY